MTERRCHDITLNERGDDSLVCDPLHNSHIHVGGLGDMLPPFFLKYSAISGGRPVLCCVPPFLRVGIKIVAASCRVNFKV